MRHTLALWMTAVLLPCTIVGCNSSYGAEPSPTCAETICTPGETVCLGNVAATCSEDGKQWITTDCGAEQGCLDGTCTARKAQCFGANDQSFCAGDSNVRELIECSENGTSEKSSTCPLTCAGGACREAPCEPNTTICGFRSVATCKKDGVGWNHTDCTKEENCPSGDCICVSGECVAQTCVPQSRGCKDETTAQNCNAKGTGYIETECEDDEACIEATGTCEKTLCSPPGGANDTDSSELAGADSTDNTNGTDGSEGTDSSTTGQDVSQPPELEPLDTAFVNVNGEKIEFRSNTGANYIAADQTLRITMDKGLTKIEISIAPIEEFDVGIFASTELEGPRVSINYHDGTPLVGMAQFRYQSLDYFLELESFPPKGGRVKGTFSGTFTEDGGANKIPFEGGTFDVKRDL